MKGGNLLNQTSQIFRHSFLPLLALPASLLIGCNNIRQSAAKSNSAGTDGGLEVVEKTDTHGNIERYSRRVTDYAKEGLYSLIDRNGNLLETANYHNDTLHGLRVIYYENGDTQIVESYQHGAFVGPYRAYYEGGALEFEGNYVANSMEGPWKRYYENGQLMEEVQFADNEENGPFTEYHENGKLKAEGYYKDGDNEEGLLKIYDEAGILVKTMNCQHGVCRTVWDKEKDVEGG